MGRLFFLFFPDREGEIDVYSSHGNRNQKQAGPGKGQGRVQ